MYVRTHVTVALGVDVPVSSPRARRRQSTKRRVGEKERDRDRSTRQLRDRVEQSERAWNTQWRINNRWSESEKDGDIGVLGMPRGSAIRERIVKF